MPMGLTGSPHTFQRCMELVFRGLQWKTLIIYMDDICTFGTTFDEAFSRLDEILCRLKDAGLKLKPSKCNLFQSQINVLGHTIDSEGIKPTNEKVRAVQEWPVPRTLTELRSFVSFCSYYRRFIRGISERAAPLNRLMGAGQVFYWGEEQQQAFMDLKSALTGDEVMAYPQEKGLFIVDTDGSNFGIGGCLSQMQWNEEVQDFVERPIMFASKSLDKCQRRYCATRKELLAVVTFITQFRQYLLGKQFVLRTDCSSLRWLMSFRSPTDQMARWLEVLSQYDFKIEHRSGKKHINVDSLSRIPCDPEDCECFDRHTILEELPCKGCKTCLRRHEAWSDFAQFDDMVPLFERDSVHKSSNLGKSSAPRISRVKFCEGEFWTWICLLFSMFVVKARNCIVSFYQGLLRIGEYSRCGIGRLRIPQYSGSNWLQEDGSSITSRNPEVRGINSDFDEMASSRQAKESSSGSLKSFSVVNYSPEKMAQLQQRDPDISIVVKWLKSSSKRPKRDIVAGYSPSVRNMWLHWDSLELIDGVLFRKFVTPNKEDSFQLVIPKILRKEVLLSVHDSNTGAHLGIDKCYSRLREKFTWYKMKDSVKRHIKACVKCGMHKRPAKIPRSPLTEYTVRHPMGRISTNVNGKLRQVQG